MTFADSSKARTGDIVIAIIVIHLILVVQLLRVLYRRKA